MKQCPIRYVTCILANETCETLQDIFDTTIINHDCEMCTNYVKVTKKNLKNQFKSHIVKDNNNCCFHGFQYALSRNLPNRSNTDGNGYKFPFFVCNYLQDLITNNYSIEMDREYVREDDIRVIDGISDKFKLF